MSDDGTDEEHDGSTTGEEAASGRTPAGMPSDGGRRLSGGRLLAVMVGMALIPLGLVVLFLAATGGESGRQQVTLTLSTIGPEGVGVPTGLLTGRWNVVPDEGTGATIATEAAGPDGATGTVDATTGAVDGGVVVAGDGIAAVAVNVDLRTLTTGDPATDDAVRSGLDVGAVPYANLVLTEAVAFAELPSAGTPITVPIRADLSLHGVTAPVTLDATVRVVAGGPAPVLEISGVTEVALAEHGLEPAPGGSATATLTLDLRLVQVPDEVATATPGTGSLGTDPPGTGSG